MNESTDRLLALFGLVAGVATAATLAKLGADTLRAAPPPRKFAIRRVGAHIDAARTFNHSAALLALSALTDAGIEHYRGSFANPAMYAPLVTGSLSLLAGMHGGGDDKPSRHRVRLERPGMQRHVNSRPVCPKGSRKTNGANASPEFGIRAASNSNATPQSPARKEIPLRSGTAEFVPGSKHRTLLAAASATVSLRGQG